ncbi:hypothetical protein Pmani_011922 [Petrolisthes manimaculis]|uniref:UDP-xylose and UDP-N-acetylglucosamine transporter n=1 Tax=Petrolisthes manimaculis TaxID=1843537 RepID=A0AAE1UB02_9EUCA|nr:hypothetical protein Pmani_011922 [Petrolisthes manimaculis]
MGRGVAMVMVFLGCCSAAVFLELLVTEEPSSGYTITCAQFLFISVEGFIFTARLGTRPNIIPMKEYLVMVVLFFIVNVINNLAFRFHISMPLHMIFRCGGLVANLMVCWLVLGRRYSLVKCVSVIMITLGTFLTTLASANLSKESGDSEELGVAGYVTGVTLLTVALFMSARLGVYQEVLYITYGKHAREALFYIHILSLPGFLLTYPSIAEHVVKFNRSPPLEAVAAVPGLATIPKLWLFLAANILAQYTCISSVFSLTTHCSSLTVTLILTLRKFVSLIFSVVYFQNPFTSWHWLGTGFVFGGTLLFSDLPAKLRDAQARGVTTLERETKDKTD